MRILFCISLLFVTLFNTRAQSPPGNRLTGKIRSTSGQAVPGVALILKRSGRQTVSDAAGGFAIPLTAPDSLLIRHVGYQPQSFSVRPDRLSYLTIVLEETVATLSEVVVNTGYQSIPKERATGSFAYVDNQLLNRRVSTDVLSKLEGVVPGLLFNRNTVNSANGLADISIRGHSTLFANDQPLIVVDGFPYDGDLSNLNPNDVESVSVLKDAAAASIWGVRSGNGVIVITTKKGRMGQKLAVELNANITVGNKPDLWYNPNFLDANDFINVEDSLFVLGYYNSNISSSSHPVLSPVVQLLAKQRAGLLSQADATAQIDALRNLDIRNDLLKYFYQNTINQQYALNVNGGTSNSSYFFSAGYDRNRSNLVGNLNNKITLSSRYSFIPLKGLEISAGLNYIQYSRQSNNTLSDVKAGGIYTSGLYPYAQLADQAGNALAIVRDYAASYTDTAGGEKLMNWKYRPLDELKYADNKTQSTDNRINIGIKYHLCKDLSAEVKYQYERSATTTSNYYSDSTYYTRNLVNQYTNFSNAQPYPIPIGGILNLTNSYLTSNRLRAQLNYSKRWNSNHELVALAGSEISEAITESNANTVYGYDKNSGNFVNVNLADNFPIKPAGTSAKIPTILGFGKYTDRYISYFSNAAYTFRGRYVVSASGRIDKSNLFGVKTNQKSVPLYSVGAAWNLSKEKFYRLKWLPYTRLRVTYGVNGNINKNVTAVTTLLQASNATYSGIPYAVIKNPGNPDLTWEKIRMINFGLDFATPKQIISGSIEYYLKKGLNLFGNSPLPSSTGLTAFMGNTANISGKGLDITLNTMNIQYPNFQWTTNLLVSYAFDKVTQYNTTSSASSYLTYGAGNGGTIYPLTGKPLFAIYSYRWAGLDPQTGDPRGYVNGKISKDYKTIVSNTTMDSMVFNGTARPTTFGSLRNTFSYKKFSLSLNILYKLNYYFRRSSISYGTLYQTWVGHKDFSNRWQKPGDEQFTNIPSLQYPAVDANRASFYTYSQALVDKGDHIRLQDIRISYDIDQSQWPKNPFRHLQVYGYINNVGILWKANHDGLDPDVYSQLSYSALPDPRTFSLGISATF